jgi:thiamine biosynthesis lipoprotein
MGVDVVVGGASEIGAARLQALFDEWDAVFSRFRADSELSRLNESPPGTVLVSGLFARALRVALGAAEATGGVVDPTLGGAIEAAGYDRDFALLGEDGRPPGTAQPGAWRSVRLSGRVLARPAGMRLDLNGVVKGLAVDEALRLSPEAAFVAAGGDLAARRSTVVGLPAGGSVRLLRGGLATSSTGRRSWLRAGAAQHHLIDARTGRPARSRWTDVTVAAGTCVAADVAAKAALLLSQGGPDWLEDQDLPGRFVGDGEVVETRGWHERLEAVA